MRILIVKLGSIGDVVHTLPSLAAMRRALPEAEISWVVERRASEILRDNPLLNRLIEIDTKALRRGLMSGETLRAPRQQLRLLRASAFDLALDFQGLIKSAMIARLSGAGRIVGFAREELREPPSRILLHESVSIPTGLHVIQKNLALVGAALEISIPTEEAELEFPITIEPSHEIEADLIASETEGRYAILNPGGGWPTKLWSAEKFGTLADELWNHFGLHSLVASGPGEDELTQRALSTSKSGKAKAVSVSLKGFCALAKGAQVYVGGETGPTHLAIAMHTPVVGLLGPTEWWRNGSPYSEDVCVERTDIGCRENCHRRSCSQWICMDIEVERVLSAVEERLRRANVLIPAQLVSIG
ncbi:MAG: lipopolysaccharide heptosyltransferase I [Acidobacteria bacterium]|nr:MAG: lipopolysaccharide heptosyltransferase I [Acidobacteriota bacterium]